MNTHTDEKRYLTVLTTALQLRKISGARIGEILAEVEVHTAESGQSAVEAFGPAKEYARQFEPVTQPRPRQWGRQTWTGGLTAAIGAFLLAGGAFAGMTGEDVIGIPGWWACGIGAAVLLITFSLMPINAVIDPRRPIAAHIGRIWFMSWVVGAIVVVVLVIVGVMLLIT